MKKILTILLTCFLLSVSLFVLTACNEGNTNSGNEPHEHNYNVVKYNNENHWFECECGGKTNEVAHIIVNNSCICGYQVTQIHSHDYQTLKFDNEKHWFECECGEKTNIEEHKGGQATEDKKAVCTVCNSDYGEKLEHVHNYQTLKYSKTEHWYECKCSDKKDIEVHKPGAEATETTSQSCTICKYVIVPVLGHVHTSHLEKIDAQPQSCTETGNMEYYICDCGKLFSDSMATTEITDKDSVIIQKDEHNHLVKHNETQHWYECACGDVKDLEDHKDGIATCTEKAICKICNIEYGDFASHSLDYENEKEVTCTENGYIPCSNLDCDYKEITDIAKGHDFIHIIEVRKASCTQEQTLRKICDVCGEDEIVKGNVDKNNHVKYEYVLNPNTGLYNHIETVDITYHPQTQLENVMGACPERTCNFCNVDLVAHARMIKKVVSNGAVICTEEQLYVTVCLDCKAYIGEMEYHEPIGHKYIYSGESGYREGCAKFTVNLKCVECENKCSVYAVYNDDKTIQNGCDTYIYSYEYSNGERPETLTAEIRKEQKVIQTLPLEVDCGGGGTHVLKVGDKTVTGIEKNMTISSDNVTMPIWRAGLANAQVRWIAGVPGTCQQTSTAVFYCCEEGCVPIAVILPGDCAPTGEVKEHKATCTAGGYKYQLCSVCGGEVIIAGSETAALGHDYEWAFAQGNEPAVNGKGAYATYTAGTLVGTCKRATSATSTCGATANATAHVTDFKAATCCDAGSVVITYKDAAGKVITNKTTTLVIPNDATEHDFNSLFVKEAVYVDLEEKVVYVFVWCYAGERFVLAGKIEIADGACSSTSHSLLEIYNDGEVKVLFCSDEEKAFILEIEAE